MGAFNDAVHAMNAEPTLLKKVADLEIRMLEQEVQVAQLKRWIETLTERITSLGQAHGFFDTDH